ncbi:MAG: hypothetical protein K2R93_19945 [Gemmatimonadaceae bacterium]|nr:hypothetical protein [Gemmatimonadaceae bacterium]
MSSGDPFTLSKKPMYKVSARRAVISLCALVSLTACAVPPSVQAKMSSIAAPVATQPGTHPTVVLSPSAQSASFDGTLTAAGNGRQAWDHVLIDTRAFRNGAVLNFTIRVDVGESDGSFFLWPERTTMTVDGRPDGYLTILSNDQAKNSETRSSYTLVSGGVIRFAASGNWFSRVGSTNTYRVSVTAVPR